VHSRQALVLVNHGCPDGSKVLELSKLITQKVIDLYDIELEREVNVF